MRDPNLNTSETEKQVVSKNLLLDYTNFLKGDYQNKFDIFYDLMKFRVREVLVVASLYDDFVMEADATYAEQLTEEYSSLNISTPPPRIVRVSSADAALDLLAERRFDLVIVTSRVTGTNPFTLGQQIKEKYSEISTVLLLTSFADVATLPPKDQQQGIDHIFIYTGNSEIFLTIVKQVEDRKNIDNDTQIAKVRVIVVVEDTIAYYSLFLPIIYKVLVKQTRRLMAGSVNHSHRLLLVRGRPKVLLAQNYEEAIEYIQMYRNNLFAVISDIGFPKGGIKRGEEGFQLVDWMKNNCKNLPILLQSSDLSNQKIAQNLGVDFVHKHSPKLLQEVKRFFDHVGFGDFVFKNNQGKEIARAKDINDFRKVIRKIPPDSILYHASRDHFSNWLFTRAEFDLALELKSVSAEDFEDAEHIRSFLLQFFERTKKEKKRGVIAEFLKEDFEGTEPFTRIGNGSLGGKGRGLAFALNIINLTKNYFTKHYPDIEIGVPETIVITTDIFDDFIDDNDLADFVLNDDTTDEEIMQKFLSSNLPKELKKDLQIIAKKIKTPLAVRSSSLLEDSQFQPFAGIYTTYMLPNSEKGYKDRMKNLENAIKMVYHSTYTKIAKSYIQTVGQKIEIEKMAVVIQKVVGKDHGDILYPSISGVAQSYNYYPMDIMKSEDGVVHLAVGLGASVTEGRKYLSFCPKYPRKLIQHYSPRSSVDNSQNSFFALPLQQKVNLEGGELATLEEFDLKRAETDGELIWSAATVDWQNNRIVDSLSLDGPRVVTFPYLLKYNKFPLSDLLKDVLKIGQEAFGCDVEIEFAVNLDYVGGKHKFYILQIRPLVTDTIPIEVDLSEFAEGEEVLIYSDMVLGNGIYEGIQDIVFVDPDEFSSIITLDIKDEVAHFNKKLKDEGREYLLVGPGRWGTADRFLGIPVSWNDIDNAKAIVEYGLQDFQVDPSNGSHFFLNITSSRKGYFTVQHNSRVSKINWEFLKNREPVSRSKHVVHIRFDEAFTIILDGKAGEGVVIPESLFKDNPMNVILEE